MPSGTMPSSRAARATRTAISPRLAISRRLITEACGAALEEGAQTLLSFWADALARDRLRRDRTRVVVLVVEHATYDELRRGDGRRSGSAQLGEPAIDGGVELGRRDDIVHEPNLPRACRAEALAGEEER